MNNLVHLISGVFRIFSSGGRVGPHNFPNSKLRGITRTIIIFYDHVKTTRELRKYATTPDR